MFWDYRTSGSSDALALVADALVLFLLIGAGLAGIVPTILLAIARTRRAGQWIAIALGAAYCILIYWAIEGAFLLAAGLWQWRRSRRKPAPAV